MRNATGGPEIPREGLLLPAGPGRQLCSPAFGCLCPRDETDLGLLPFPSPDVGPQPCSLSSDLCYSAAAARNKTPQIHNLCRLGPSISGFLGSLFADGDPEVCAWSPRHSAPVPSCYSPLLFTKDQNKILRLVAPMWCFLLRRNCTCSQGPQGHRDLSPLCGCIE